MRVRWEDFGAKNQEISEKTSDIHILAKRVTVQINDYTQADTFDAEIDYKQFPFDPRSIRAVAVTIAMEDTGHLYDDTTNKPTRITPRAAPDADPNVIFIGFADDESITFDDSKRTVRLEGRDNTALLVDRKYLGGPVNLEDPVNVVIESLLAELQETVKLDVDNRTRGELPTLAKFYDTKHDTSGKKNPERDESYWDLIQRIIAQAGLICYIELDKLVISRPRVLYGTSNIKRFIYGRNVKNLEFKRKIGRRKNFNVAVRSMNLTTKEVLTAFIPKEATAEWSAETGIPAVEVLIPEVLPSGQKANPDAPPAEGKPAPYISFRIANVNDKDHLIEVGQSIYEELGRQQLEGSLETADMMTWESDASDNSKTRKEFDILKLRNGTPVSIWIDPKDMQNVVQFANQESRELYLRARNIDPKAAKYLAENIGKADASFYTKSVEFSLDETQGFKCKIDFINFINIENPNVDTGA